MLMFYLYISAIINVALSQQEIEEPTTYTCTDGYEYDIERQVCKDIDECVTLSGACKGGMRCVNHFGGYLCLPHNAQIIVSQGEEEEVDNSNAPPPAQPVQHGLLPPVAAADNANANVPPPVYQPQQTPFQPRPRPQPRPAPRVIDSSASVYMQVGAGQQPPVIRCMAGLELDENNYCRDVDECATGSPCQQQCINVLGSFLCKCDIGYDLAADAVSCQDINECAYSPYMCQYECLNKLGSYACSCPEGYQLQGTRLCQDINECESGHNCNEEQMCWNYQGGFRCYPKNPCREPYVQTGEGRCSCQSVEICRGLPPSIVYKYMSLSSERTVPADIFQIQATSVYPNMVNTFRIKAGNQGDEFFLRRTSNVSAMLVMTRSLRGPREHVVDLEMITQNSGINLRSLLRLTIIIGAHPF